jgi:hypothetical protein
MRAEIVGFTGINFSGQRMTVEIWPSGSVQGELDGERMKSIGIIAPVGTRITLRTSTSEEGWLRYPWRSVEVREGCTFEARDGKRVGVQVPDLDHKDDPFAIRSNPLLAAGFQQVSSLDERPDWTYGLRGQGTFRGKVRVIEIDWVGA